MKRFNLYVAILLMCLLGTCSMVKAETIKVTQAGTLYSLVGNKLNTMTELIVTGPLNGDDIACIRDMEALEILNMKGASIVSGGGPYYGQLTTQNNIVGDKMFFGLSQLKKIIFPANVTTIGEDSDSGGGPDYNYGSYAVARCINLEEVEFPTALEKIGAKAFERCIRLKKVALPEGVEYLCSYAFMNCDALTSVSIPSTLSYSSSSSNGYTFWGCDNLTEVSLAEGITELNFGMFQRCKSLISIKLPQSLTKINNAFVDCSGLTSINIPNKVTSTGDFSGCSSLTTVVIPEGVTSIGSFANCTNLTSITLPSTLTSFGSFSNCTSLESIELPDAITELPDYPYAFQGCTKLKSIKLPQKLNIINGHAFEGCSSLATIELPNRVTTLGAYAFQNCRKLESVILPSTLTKIETRENGWDSGAFYNCISLKTINFPQALTSIPSYTFYGNSLESIELPGVTEIANYAFQGCSKLEHVIFSSKLTTIGANAFNGCSFTSLELPASLKTIGEQAFYKYNSQRINTVVWNSSSEIPRNVFLSITYLFVPNGVTGSNVDAANIIRGGLTDSFEAKTESKYVDNRTIFYYEIPQAFKAKKALYSRRFTQTSGIGTARGWETIVLPFDVNKFTYTGYNSDSGENIALAPFGSEALQTEGTRPFWLYEMTTEGPQRATTLKAHTPYLICMPNNGKYPNSSNIYGNVNFIGEDETNGVLISETEGKLTTAQGQEYNLVPTYETVPKSESVYALNIGSWYDEHQEGSVFIKNYQDVNPFYAYATPTSTASAAKAPKYFSIGGGGATGIEEQLLMTPEQLTRVYSTDGIIYIHCSKAQIISIYDVNGRTVYTLKATEGDNEVHTLPDGTYFLEGQKVIVKH
ncbi:leucine-rich repeat protein [Bacteroides nordii]|uniref:leucine-rich repeat protein n=1 Tax=Bacteroides nordii TaxID=291645 RepID=UPI002A83C44C|nr:leucine-rich repeat protein [Bacteroides nordii]